MTQRNKQRDLSCPAPRGCLDRRDAAAYLSISTRLIDCLPARLTDTNANVVTISKLADEYIRTRGSGQAPATLVLYRKGKKNLLECFGDVDLEQNTILIHSPKTRRLGKSARLVPIFAALEPLLSQAFAEAVEGEQYVFPVLRTHANVAKIAGDIITRAKLTVWPKMFNSLRATTETDLMDQYGLRRACQWAGNSPATAMKNYALVRKTDFLDDGISVENGNKMLTQNPTHETQSDAKSDSTEKHAPGKTRKKSTVKN